MSIPVSESGVLKSQCRWLVFDAVGTLIHPTPSVAVAYHSIASRYGSQFTVSEVGDRFRQAFRRSEIDVFPNGPAAGSHWFSSNEIEIARWRWIVSEVVPDVNDIERCFGELWDHFARPASWACFDDVQVALHSLAKAGYRLAIASNFDSRLHSVCDGHGELEPIQRRFVSSETGFRKPSPDFYSAVISQCECRPNEILMVGDDPEHDVAGPVAMGMKAILIDRGTKNPVRNSIRSLSELA